MRRLPRLSLPTLGCGLLLLVHTAVAGQRFSEGLHYHRIDPPQPLEAQREPGHVEVVEMFLYACPHCYELAPRLKRWLKARPYVDFHRMPAIVGPSWADQARAHYIAEALGGGDRLQQALFEAIHEDGREIYNEPAVIAFFVDQGFEARRVRDLYHSPEIMAKVNEARAKTVAYRLRGVPAVVVDGRYVTAPYFVRSQEEMLEVLGQLVDRERAASRSR